MRRLATLALLLVVASIARAAEPPPPGLGHDHPLTGRIWNVAQGRFVTMNALAAAVSAARFALLGERHDHPEHHEFQAWLLRRMLESGRRPAVAFEMLDTTQAPALARRSEEHTSELQSRFDLVCRLLLEKKKINITTTLLSLSATSS